MWVHMAEHNLINGNKSSEQDVRLDSNNVKIVVHRFWFPANVRCSKHHNVSFCHCFNIIPAHYHTFHKFISSDHVCEYHHAIKEICLEAMASLRAGTPSFSASTPFKASWTSNSSITAPNLQIGKHPRQLIVLTQTSIKSRPPLTRNI